MHVPGLAGVPLRRAAIATLKQSMRDDVLSYSAALAFHALLALFPFLLFLVALLAILHVPHFFDWLLEQAQTVAPPAAIEEVAHVTQETARAHGGGLLSLSMAGAIWAASGGLRSAMRALNVAYDVTEPRGAWRRYVASVVYTVALAALVIAALGLMLVGPELVGRIATPLGLGTAATTLWLWLRYPAAVALLVVVASMVYTVVPAVDGFRLVTPGSVTAVVLWVLASLAFRVYTTRLGHYSALYGSIGAVIVLLIYFWISSIILLVGAELNAVVRHQATGEPR